VPGEPGGLRRTAAQHVGPHVEVVAPGPFGPAGEIDRGAHLGPRPPGGHPGSPGLGRIGPDIGGPSVGRHIAVRLLGPNQKLFSLVDRRVLGRVGPLER
jgi:hypothetical protein